MRTCKFCGREISDAAVFCRHCGKSLVEKDKEEVHSTLETKEIEVSLDERIKNLKNDVDSLMEEFKKTIAKNEELSKEIAVLKEEKESLEKTADLLKEKEKQTEDLKEELKNSKQIITDLETQIADLNKSQEPLNEETTKDTTMPDNGGIGTKLNDQGDIKQPETVVEEESEEPVDTLPINFCKYCGAKLASDALFCLRCGKKIR